LIEPFARRGVQHVFDYELIVAVILHFQHVFIVLGTL